MIDMGYYINNNSKGELLPSKGKALELLNDGGGRIKEPRYQGNLICIVDNGAFDAAVYCYCHAEFHYFLMDSRPKQWITHPKAKELANYK